MAEQFPIRAIREDEFDLFHAATEHAFHEPPPSAQRRADMLARFELDRSLAAFDGSTPVGSAGAWTFRMCVPGALPPVAGVTWIAVMPSYRRRGILSSLIRHQFADIRDRGEPLAVLWASEAQIYGRFGYGRASWQANFTFAHGEGALAPDVPTDPGLRLRIAEPRSAMTELAKTYDELLPVQPGLFTRNESWWNYVLADPEEERQGASPVRCVLAEDDAGPRGYALYSSRGRWDEQTFLPDATLDVRELIATDPAATAALWADLLSRDLVSELTARLRPVDDPLLQLLTDPRRARPRVSDGLWVRLMDLPEALSLRHYACPVDVVIEVADGMCPWNQGRWRLTSAGPAGARAGRDPAGGAVTAGRAATPGGAVCERTSAAADITLPVATLGAAYLGGTRLGALARAGLATEARPGALDALSTAMSWDPAPWCPLIF
jgi:predicted acetyltransferase